MGWVVSIDQDFTKTLVIDNLDEYEVNIPTDLTGSIVDFKGVSISDSQTTDPMTDTFSLFKDLEPAPIQRKLIERQIMTGQSRIDLLSPIAEGDYVLFKGPSSTGKLRTAMDTARQYMEQGNEVVFCSYRAKDVVRFQKDIGTLSSLLTGFTSTNFSTELDYYMLHRSALKYAINRRD